MTEPEGSQPEVSAVQWPGLRTKRKQPEPTGSHKLGQKLGQNRLQIPIEEFPRQCDQQRSCPLARTSRFRLSVSGCVLQLICRSRSRPRRASIRNVVSCAARIRFPRINVYDGGVSPPAEASRIARSSGSASWSLARLARSLALMTSSRAAALIVKPSPCSNVDRTTSSSYGTRWPSGASRPARTSNGPASVIHVDMPARSSVVAVDLDRQGARFGVGHPADVEAGVQLAESAGQAVEVGPLWRTTQSASSVGRSAPYPMAATPPTIKVTSAW